MFPGDIDKSLQVKFSNMVRRQSVQELLKRARRFRRDAVCDWNPTVNMVTESLLLGGGGTNKKDAEIATAILMELSILHGIVVTEPDGKMQLLEIFEDKFMITNGDRKTHKCTELFQSLAQDRSLSLEDKSMAADIILDVFDHTLFAPGDWHTGMNMLQGIFNIYWHVLLKHTKKW